ncbi:hypothetical protein [Pisciglobus halotolerans]|uniref:DUF1659 domain-containing protein n=1 Tax=Pisciglobus halotolerans TaxID=745365 RepID=A0A1I3D140_9LACT|nr:hypothetical protein [Pisciglobus halotolerans]SFH80423.1 hypothetical protein SAMN04489868_12634 [Pisciglobus halotolerans]
MQKEWNKGAIEVYFEDVENEKVIRRSYGNTIEQVNEDQVAGFTAAIESLTALPLAHTVVVEQYKYIR